MLGPHGQMRHESPTLLYKGRLWMVFKQEALLTHPLILGVKDQRQS